LMWKSTHAGLGGWFGTGGSEWGLGIGSEHVAHRGHVGGLGTTEALLGGTLDAVRAGVLTRGELVLVKV